MTQQARILQALGEGLATSREIAARLGADRRRIAVALCALSLRGAIVRAGVASSRLGRPCVIWRLAGRTNRR